MPRFSLLIGLIAASTCVHANQLDLEIVGIRHPGSTVYVALYDQPAGFPGKGAPLAVAKSQADRTSAQASFADLPFGHYAIAVYEDVDGNGKLNLNLFGAPSEPFGLSNNVVPRGGPPSFGQAAFELRRAERLTIKLR